MSINIENDDDYITSEESTSEFTSDVLSDKNLQNLMDIEYTYPSPEDKDFQNKIYKKREFYYHKMPTRKELVDYDEIRNYREQVCGRKGELLEQQSFLSNYINPDTPYKGVLICHATGTGKTCAGIAIAERFKQMVQKYGTKIYVLVSGPLIKENWKNELINPKCTGETYLKQQDATVYMNEADRTKAKKNAMNNALQYYRFMSYRSFYKKVLGEKIVEKVKTKDNKIKNVFRKTEEGDFERDISIDRIYNLNNSLIIIDEAHNLTGNAHGDALMKIIKNSSNLKIVLMTATPMKNLADDIIELINFIRPPNDPIIRDKIFTSQKNHTMEFKQGGIEYLKEMSRGYVSYLRGTDPLIFAKRIEKGEIPNGLMFTKVTKCKMLEFQRTTYDSAISVADDTLDRRSEAVANFVFPVLSPDGKNLIGQYGREGINILKNQLMTNSELINKKVALEILKNKSLENDNDLVHISENGLSISGKILKLENLKFFSVKFYKALKKVNRLVWGKKGAGTGFVYSNLVKVGIELFVEILLQNGYLEYDANYNNYKIKADTRCYFCGNTYKEHEEHHAKSKLSRHEQSKHEQSRHIDKQSESSESNVSDSSTDYEEKYKDVKNVPEHTFYPTTFVTVTGKSSEETADIMPEEKKFILDNVFSNTDNIEGKFIKLVLGSKVMNEGISLKNVSQVHVLDVYFNLGRIDQVIGRAIRYCSHINVMSKENPYPEVAVYKYTVALENGLSSEEELYHKAELKYLLVKKVERVLKEVAIDCPLNRNKNIFPEELKHYQNCVKPSENNDKNQITCPLICDFMDCNYKCDSKKLNDKYFDENINAYRTLNKNELDYTTFTQNLAKNEIETTKNKIKELYRIKYVYTLKDIINYIRNSFEGEKKDLFDEFFVFKALDELIPLTENDFNNFKDTVFDKYNRSGYLIYVDKYYIFQPFDQNEDVPMYYRSVFDKPMQSQLTLYNYLKNVVKYAGPKKEKQKKEITTEKQISVYDFESVRDYYDNRNEFKYVGIIDKEPSRRKTKSVDELVDVFKIREKRSKILDKKRGTGIMTLYGAVCATAKSKEQLIDICKSVDITIGKETRVTTCDNIKNKLLFLEKYGTVKKGNKVTYVMVPANHPKYPFPYNLEDRKDHIINKIKENIKFKIDVDVKENKSKVDKIDVVTYQIEIKNTEQVKEFSKLFTDIGLKLEGNKWIIKVE